jgi:hypothetical protein
MESICINSNFVNKIKYSIDSPKMRVETNDLKNKLVENNYYRQTLPADGQLNSKPKSKQFFLQLFDTTLPERFVFP